MAEPKREAAAVLDELSRLREFRAAIHDTVCNLALAELARQKETPAWARIGDAVTAVVRLDAAGLGRTPRTLKGKALAARQELLSVTEGVKVQNELIALRLTELARDPSSDPAVQVIADRWLIRLRPDLLINDAWRVVQRERQWKQGSKKRKEIDRHAARARALLAADKSLTPDIIAWKIADECRKAGRETCRGWTIRTQLYRRGVFRK